MKLPTRTVMTSALLATLLFGCGSDQTADPPTGEKLDRSEKIAEELGGIELRLTFPNGTRLDALTYTILSVWGFIAQDTIPVGDEATVSFQLGNLPALAEPFAYQLALNATTSDGIYCTSPGAQFGVVAGETTLISTTLVCGADMPPFTGSVRADVDIVRQPNCAYVAGISAPSLRAKLGEPIPLQAFATTVQARFAWSVTPESAGTFAQSDSASTSFLCAEAGSYELVVTVTSEPGCAPDADPVVVTCLPDEPAPPPEG